MLLSYPDSATRSGFWGEKKKTGQAENLKKSRRKLKKSNSMEIPYARITSDDRPIDCDFLETVTGKYYHVSYFHDGTIIDIDEISKDEFLDDSRGTIKEITG
jgi:hypothetical protein